MSIYFQWDLFNTVIFLTGYVQHRLLLDASGSRIQLDILSMNQNDGFGL